MISARCCQNAWPRRGGRASWPHGSRPLPASCSEPSPAPVLAPATAGSRRPAAPVSPCCLDSCLHVANCNLFQCVSIWKMSTLAPRAFFGLLEASKVLSWYMPVCDIEAHIVLGLEFRQPLKIYSWNFCLSWSDLLKVAGLRSVASRAQVASPFSACAVMAVDTDTCTLCTGQTGGGAALLMVLGHISRWAGSASMDLQRRWAADAPHLEGLDPPPPRETLEGNARLRLEVSALTSRQLNVRHLILTK